LNFYSDPFFILCTSGTTGFHRPRDKKVQQYYKAHLHYRYIFIYINKKG